MRRSLRLLLDGEDERGGDRRSRGPGVCRAPRGGSSATGAAARSEHARRARASKRSASCASGRRTTQVVALTMEDNPVFAQRAFAAGAVGFVMKERSDAELLQAIRSAARGEEYISPQVAARLDAIAPLAHRGRVDLARGRGSTADRAWIHERRNRAQAAHLPAHGGDTPRPHLSQARSRHAGRTGPLRAGTRPAENLTRPCGPRPRAAGDVAVVCGQPGAEDCSPLARVDAERTAGQAHALAAFPPSPKPCARGLRVKAAAVVLHLDPNSSPRLAHRARAPGLRGRAWRRS